MKVVVAGASGFIGGSLYSALKAIGQNVIGVSRQNGSLFEHVSSYAETPDGDILVFAAEPNSLKDVLESGEQGILHRLQTLEELASRSWSRIIYLSSAVVYGDTSADPYLTSAGYSPKDAYASTKIRIEQLLLKNSNSIILRLTNVYGTGMSGSNVVSTILRQAGGPGPIVVQNVDPIRDFIWVDDVIDLISKIIVDERDASAVSNIFNVGTGIGTSIGELAKIVDLAAGAHDRQVISRVSGSRPSSIVVDIVDTTSTWGWTPQISLFDGVSSLLRSLDR